MTGADLAALRRRVRLLIGARRRLLAAVLAAVATGAVVQSVRPDRSGSSAGPTASVLVAAHDLAAGAALGTGDLRPEALPVGVVPAGALPGGSAYVGRVTTAAARRGEPFTDARFVGPGLLGPSAAADGLVATPVRIADPAEVGLLRPGDHVDVLAAATSAADSAGLPSAAGGEAGSAAVTTPAEDAVVLAVPRAGQAAPGDDGALVVLATSPSEARLLAGAAVTSRLSVTLGSRSRL